LFVVITVLPNHWLFVVITVLPNHWLFVVITVLPNHWLFVVITVLPNHWLFLRQCSASLRHFVFEVPVGAPVAACIDTLCFTFFSRSALNCKLTI
jgi:hypothetical protein